MYQQLARRLIFMHAHYCPIIEGCFNMTHKIQMHYWFSDRIYNTHNRIKEEEEEEKNRVVDRHD